MALGKTQNNNSVLREFFFAEEVPFGMAIARILVPLAVGLPMWLRFTRVRELFSSDGTTMQLFELYGNGPRLPVFSPSISVPLYGIMLLCLVLSTIGFRTRAALWIATPLYIYFNLLDGVGTMTKYSVIGAHLLFILAVSNAGLVWSVDAAMTRRNAGGIEIVPPRAPVWPARLMQLLFCYIYFGAAVTKIQTEAFFSGEQMRYWMLSNWNYENPVGEVMAMWSWLLPVSAYLAVVWEILFAFLVFQRRTRVLMLGLGTIFHLMTWLTLGLYIFPAICISGYFGFAMEGDVLKIRSKLRRMRLLNLLKWPFRLVERRLLAAPNYMPAAGTFACLLGIAAIGATEIESRQNLYGRSSDGSAMVLAKMDTGVARAMLQTERPLREQDKFFSFDLGTIMVGNQLANHRKEFTYGETIIAQCNLNPPHEDLWVECLVQDEQQRTIEQFGDIVPREKLRYSFVYNLGNKLLPGTYSMVLKSANKEISRRVFQLSGEPPADAEQLLTN